MNRRLTVMGSPAVYPAELVIDVKYTWEMGAKPLICKYVGRGRKAMTYTFQLGKSLHTLSYFDVLRYISYEQTI